MSFTADVCTYALGTVLVSGTPVAFGAQPPDNCHTILVTNPSTTATGLVGFVGPATPLVPGVNAQRVPPGAMITLGIGAEGLRGKIANFRADSIGGACALEATYINQIGAVT